MSSCKCGYQAMQYSKSANISSKQGQYKFFNANNKLRHSSKKIELLWKINRDKINLPGGEMYFAIGSN